MISTYVNVYFSNIVNDYYLNLCFLQCQGKKKILFILISNIRVLYGSRSIYLYVSVHACMCALINLFLVSLVRLFDTFQMANPLFSNRGRAMEIIVGKERVDWYGERVRGSPLIVKIKRWCIQARFVEFCCIQTHKKLNNNVKTFLITYWESHSESLLFTSPHLFLIYQSLMIHLI